MRCFPGGPALAVGLFLLPVPISSVQAQDSQGQSLETIEVRDAPDGPLSGSGNGEGGYRFDREAIDDFGGVDGSLDGVLRRVPGLQFSEQSEEAGSGADLRPESLSISGGRAYENRFTLDGLGVGNRLDPAADNPSAAHDVPGHEQSYFIDSSLIGEVRVFDSNVPASHGGFTGGVVEMETRRAGSRPEGNLVVGTTRSDWVNYRRFAPEREPDEEGGLPPEPPAEPDYQRDRLAVNYSTPLGEAAGLVLGANRQTSREPVVSLGETHPTRQRNDNFLGKLSLPVGATGLLDLDVRYAPYENEQLIEDARGSDYTIRGGGYGISASLEALGVHLDHEATLGLNVSENRRTAPGDFYNWAITRSRDWGRQADAGSSREGGFGDLDKRQTALQGQWKARTAGTHVGGLPVRHEFGVELEQARYYFHRSRVHRSYQDPVVNGAVECLGQSEDCVEGEQYFSRRQVYPADEVEVALNRGALFGETTLGRGGGIRATVGLRYSYDDFLGNHDVAPRTRLTWDLFGEGGTVLRAGYNRYYGAALLTYKLREARQPYYEEYRGTEQNIVEEWQRDSGRGNYRYRFGDLDTPYSDERMLGLEQDLLGGRLRLQTVRRANRDEFARTTTSVEPDGYRYYEMNNRGSSDYEGYSLAWFGRFGATRVNLNATYSETTTRNADYDDPVDDTRPAEAVQYEGERVRYGELEILREDFARPWIARVGVSHAWSSRLKTTLTARYRGAYERIVATGETVEGELVDNGNGGTEREELAVYADQRRPAVALADLRLSWTPWQSGSHRLTTELEVNNLLDARAHTVPEGQSGVERGRHYWLSLRYGF